MAARIIGADRHIRRLRNLQNADVLRALYAAGQEIELEAERSITQGAVSGKGHVPSKPGEPPKADTRLLDSSIETTIESAEPPKVLVTSNAPYSAALEWGTSKMAERPFMRPALAKKRSVVGDRVRAAIKRANRT